MQTLILARATLVVLASGLTFAVPSSAEVTREQIDEESVTVVRMTVDPSLATEPALKHRLLPHVSEREPGNAVPFYHRALTEMQRVHSSLREELGEDYQGWWHVEPQAFPLEGARQAMREFDPLVRDHLRQASRRQFADWGFHEESLRGEETIAFLLPEVHATRDIGRMLSIRARLAIAEGRYSDAIDSLQIGLQLARDVSASKFLVSDLVGIAIAGTLELRLEEFIAGEGSPNLYWSLMALPDPLIISGDSVELEMTLGLRMFPWLADIETAEYAPDEWRRLYTETLVKVLSDFDRRSTFAALTGPNARLPEEGVRTMKYALTTLQSLETYPAAKEALVAGGLPREHVEQMPVAQVLALQTARAYRVVADEFEKAWYAPYRDANRLEQAAMSRLGDVSDAHGRAVAWGPIPLADKLLPAVASFRQAHEQLRRQMAAMAVIEALRLHAAETGRLPESLADVRVVPIPDNPATGEPFEYRLEGDTAILELPTSEGFHLGKRYEIALRN